MLWLGLLIFGFVVTRIFCFLGIPGDCRNFQVFVSLAQLIGLGAVQGWIVGAFSDPGRFKKFPWILGFTISIPLFSILSDLPVCQRSIVSDSEMPRDFQVLLIRVTISILLILGWHFWFSWFSLDRREFRIFWASRLFGSLAIVSAYSLALFSRNFQVHLHHYFIAWCLSTIAIFDHPISSGFLALTTAIFVQGVGAYSADSVLKF